ncbi:MAG: ssDNA-binding protein, partial [Pseudomonadota bacterium]
GLVRLAFNKLDKPSEAKGDDKGGRRSAVLIFPKGADVSPIKLIVKEAGQETFGANFEKPAFANKLTNPLKPASTFVDQTGELYEGFDPDEASYGLNVTTYYDMEAEESLRDAALNPTGFGAFYSGCYCIARVKARGYQRPEKKGVTMYVSALQFVAHGDKFGGDIDHSRGFKAFAPADDQINAPPERDDSIANQFM